MNQNDKQETKSGLVNALKIYHKLQDDCRMTFEVGGRLITAIRFSEQNSQIEHTAVTA